MKEYPDNYECDDQMELFDYIPDPDVVLDVNIRGYVTMLTALDAIMHFWIVRRICLNVRIVAKWCAGMIGTE